MSDHKEEKPEAAKPDAAGAKKGGLPLPLIGAAIGAVVLGSVLGVFILAPRLAPSHAPADATSASAEKGKGEGKGKGEHDKSGGEKGGEKAEAGVIHRIDNLIVNPAGSQGRRFLMMSVAIEVPDAKAEGQLREHDAQLRDAILGALESESITTITSLGGRDSVRFAIQRVVQPLVADAEYVHVYLPQFVLQ
jgi:flagellar basal body-associated protein FliL